MKNNQIPEDQENLTLIIWNASALERDWPLNLYVGTHVMRMFTARSMDLLLTADSREKNRKELFL